MVEAIFRSDRCGAVQTLQMWRPQKLETFTSAGVEYPLNLAQWSTLTYRLTCNLSSLIPNWISLVCLIYAQTKQVYVGLKWDFCFVHFDCHKIEIEKITKSKKERRNQFNWKWEEDGAEKVGQSGIFLISKKNEIENWEGKMEIENGGKRMQKKWVNQASAEKPRCWL